MSTTLWVIRQPGTGPLTLLKEDLSWFTMPPIWDPTTLQTTIHVKTFQNQGAAQQFITDNSINGIAAEVLTLKFKVKKGSTKPTLKPPNDPQVDQTGWFENGVFQVRWNDETEHDLDVGQTTFRDQWDPTQWPFQSGSSPRIRLVVPIGIAANLVRQAYQTAFQSGWNSANIAFLQLVQLIPQWAQQAEGIGRQEQAYDDNPPQDGGSYQGPTLQDVLDQVDQWHQDTDPGRNQELQTELAKNDFFFLQNYISAGPRGNVQFQIRRLKNNEEDWPQTS